MTENKDSSKTSLSQAHTLDEIAEFWDTHSLADYWDQTHEVDFTVRAHPRRRITVAPELFEKLEQQARIRGLNPETLVNLWLAERLQEAT